MRHYTQGKGISMKLSSHQSHPYAGFGRRFLAYVIDGFFVSLLTMLFQTAIGQNPFTYLAEALAQNPEKIATLQSSPMYTVSQISSYIVYILYTLIFWTAYEGATPGKRILGIRIIREGSNNLSLPTAIVRMFGMVLSAIPLGLGYLWVIWDKKKQAWHDKMAQTVVIRTAAKTNTALIVIMFIIALCYQLVIFASGGILGFMIAKESIGLKKQNSDAVKSYKESIDSLSPEAKAHYEKSQELFGQMKENSSNRQKVITLNDENIRELSAAIEAAPNVARLLFELGNAYTWISSKGTLEDGLKAYGKAEELEPDNVIYVTSVGDMLIRLGKFEDAVLQLKKALRMNANYAQPEYLIGIAYKNLKINAEARTHLQAAIDIWSKQNDKGEFDDEILNAQQELSGIPN